MRIKRSAMKARQRRNRAHRQASSRSSARRKLTCEILESRVLLDAGGLFLGDGVPGDGLPDPIDPVLPLDPGVISGRVWEDVDGNRQEGGNEPGLGGVTVYSDFNFNGALDANEPSTVTTFDDPATDFDEGGFYTLDNLQPGYHNVRQVTPGGFKQTFPSLPDGYLPPPWGDASVHVTFVEQSQVVDDVNFGNKKIEPGSVHGTKWDDTNGNAERDPDEPGLPGVVIYSDRNLNGILDLGEPQTVTMEDDQSTDFDESGQYWLTGLEPGFHWIKEVVPDGFQQTFPISWLLDPAQVPGDDAFLPGPFPGDAAHDVLIHSGETIEGLDFGNQRIVPGSVHGIKWHDVNGNTLRDPGEVGLAGVVIYSDRNFNGVLDPDEPQTVTMADNPDTDFDESGLYWLENLDMGWNWIKEVVPDGSVQTFPWFGRPHDVFITPGLSVDNINFGNQQIARGSIHGTKWEDLNGDSFRDAHEPGLAGVTIYSDTNGNAILDFNEPHTVTMADDPATDFDESGLYWLDVEPGFHIVREVVPDGFRQTFPANFFPALQPDDPLDTGILPPQDGAHFVSVGQGQSVEGIDFGNHKIDPGSISGVKWGDENGNAEFDPWESGLAGVTVYADLNDNGFFEPNEPSAITTADIPETDFDEGGRYTLAGLATGDYVIREVVPDGFRQTFPLIDLPRPLPGGSDVGIPVDEFATVEPGRLDFILAAGDVFDAEVAVTIHPSILLPIEIDVIASSADVEIINLSGPQLNGGTGDTSVFQIQIVSLGVEFDGELQFVDLLGGNVFASIPLTISLGLSEDGSHRVTLGPGETLEGLNFGNQAIVTGTGTVSGRKWKDLNGNAEHDPDEAGLAGVTIYADLNFNGRLDPNEPSAITTADIPETDFDEGGLYSFETPTGFQAIREVLPTGYLQTFPISDASSPLEQGAHFVTVAVGDHLEGLDFGNQPIEANASVSGTKWADANGNGQRDANEVGLGGVTIYTDLNRNFVFDPDEPHAVTTYDIPETDFDEGGLYSIGNLTPGFHVIREVVPDGYWQTFPISIAASPLEQGAHYVNLTSGSHADGLDFGNQQIAFPLPGDFNHDGVVDGVDLDVWEEGFGGNSLATADAADGNFDGGSFLTWQRNLGRVSSQPPKAFVALEASEVSNDIVTTKPAENIEDSLVGLSRRDYSPQLRAVRVLARENAFAEVSGRSGWRSPQRTDFTASSATESVSVADSTESSEATDLEQAFDAALTLAFGE